MSNYILACILNYQFISVTDTKDHTGISSIGCFYQRIVLLLSKTKITDHSVDFVVITNITV
jgi:hypothetical protein